MKYLVLLFIIPLFSTISVAQESTSVNTVIDSLYREDQFYLGVTYNLLSKKPNGISQNGFSSGVHFGFIRDMPINKRRNKAIGLGLGLSVNSYIQNLLISQDSKTLGFTVLNDDTDYTKNKFNTYVIEMPLQYRWRTSTATQYSFWRIYTGVKFGYVLANNTKFEGSPENINLKNTEVFNTLQYGLTFCAGYNTWNFYLYYGLNDIFDTATVNAEPIDMTAIKVGLMFYIL